MKKSLLLLAGLLFLVSYPLESQGLLNKVRNAVSKEITSIAGGDTGNNNPEPGPEPSCARDDAKLILDLVKYKIDYKEISISMKDDGSMLVKDKNEGKYYIVKDGISQGPYSENDPRVREFDVLKYESAGDQENAAWVKRYPHYIIPSGDKYLIKFGGKDYGPYAVINDFAVAKTNDKFAAIVIENVLVTENESKRMEEAIKNAKTDQERMDIAMKFGQQMQNQLMQEEGTSTIQQKLISNTQVTSYDPVTWSGGKLNGTAKFDDILVISSDRIMDLQGKTVLNLNQNPYNTSDFFVNSSTTMYAIHKFGTITFSDNTTLSELFNPSLVKAEGKVYLAYMYYSPGKNAIMQGSIPF